MKFRKETSIPLYELFWILLGILSIISVILLTFGVFKPLYIVISTPIFFTLFLLVFKIRPEIKDYRFTWIILVILLFGLILRIVPWQYLEGGQDEGVYMVMSKQYETSGKLSFDDISKPFLNETTEKLYKEKGAWYVLGLKENADSGALYFDFYPLHPLLMSVTGFILGDDFRAYSITIFSILSLIGAYLLTYELSKSKYAGCVAAGILAVSPLHLYFSRFPVTEIIGLALTLNILYFLLIAFKSKRFIYLAISLLLINMFMYLRLTWIIALPFCFITAGVAILYSRERKQQNKWVLWGAILLILFLLSTLFYYLKIRFLYDHFYDMIFQYIPSYLFYIAILSTPVLILILTKVLKEKTKKILQFIYEKRLIFIWAILIILFLFSIYNFYLTAFSDVFVGTSMQTKWELAHGGWYTIKDQALTSIILYLTPFGFLLYLIFLKKINTPQKLLVTFFLFSFLAFNIIETRYIPYQFYYARYQFSEIVPLMYVFVSMFLIDIYKKHKWIFAMLLFVIIAYNGFFSAYQFQGYVGTTPTFFHELEKNVTKQDMIIYYDPTDWPKSFFFSPLKYYYQFPSILATSIEDVKTYGNEVKKTDTVYVLSTVKIEEKGFTLVSSLIYERGFYANANEGIPPLTWQVNDNQIPLCNLVIPSKYCGGLIPIKYNKGSILMYLYRY
ncbi:glycosyltransferase family 39 protein [Candidatus Dojkabacteria bacterium]|jgi:hypothetical protein|nr:glycosyltransferase family 39 protein [Candidatus Dojkabacteria bacterium]